jgi:hypothetical protein
VIIDHGEMTTSHALQRDSSGAIATVIMMADDLRAGVFGAASPAAFSIGCVSLKLFFSALSLNLDKGQLLLLG